MNKKEYKKPEISELNSNLTKGTTLDGVGPGASLKKNRAAESAGGAMSSPS